MFFALMKLISWNSLMVVEWGVSDLGPVNLDPQVDLKELGRAYFEPAKISDQMRAKVDEAVKQLFNTAYEETIAILKKKKRQLDQLSKILVEKKTLGQEEFEELMKKG